MILPEAQATFKVANKEVATGKIQYGWDNIKITVTGDGGRLSLKSGVCTIITTIEAHIYFYLDLFI